MNSQRAVSGDIPALLASTNENFTVSRFSPIRRIPEILRTHRIPRRSSLPLVIWIVAYLHVDGGERAEK